jgi:transposase
MIELTSVGNIYFYPAKIDMRRGLDGLVNLIQSEFDLAAEVGSLFIFHGHDRAKFKIIQKDKTGYWMYSRRSSVGKYIYPKDSSSSLLISKQQLLWFLDGLSAIQPTAHVPTDHLKTF